VHLLDEGDNLSVLVNVGDRLRRRALLGLIVIVKVIVVARVGVALAL
jgi:hypothetical protein